MPQLVYLDSSDFSDLSTPQERQNPADTQILTALRRARDDKSAVFLMSPPLLSEAVHATEANKEDSVRRATLMSELCGTAILRYPTDICKIEITRSLAGEQNIALTVNDIMSADNEWFGSKYDTTTLKETRTKARSTMQREMRKRLLEVPRDQRRKLKSMLDLSKKSSRPHWKQLFKQSGWTSDSLDFPANLMDTDLFIEWLLGGKTDDQMQLHLKGILTDPYVLFRHVVDQTGHRDTLYKIARIGGDNLSANLEKLSYSILRLNAAAADLGTPINARELAHQLISATFVRDFITTLSGRSIEYISDGEVNELVKRCPSVATVMHVLEEYIHSLIQSNLMRARGGDGTPTVPRRSDFGDFMHLFYAPYVDIFRCDARFGAHLKTYPPLRARVAAKRRDILALLSPQQA